MLNEKSDTCQVKSDKAIHKVLRNNRLLITEEIEHVQNHVIKVMIYKELILKIIKSG